jgi:hypothetical protein
VYAVSLTVSDGLKSDLEYLLITVRGNQPPVADLARTSSLGYVGSSVVLDGTASRDPDGDELAYRWDLLTSTNGTAPSIRAAEAPVTYFVPAAEGVYLVQLAVTDSVASASAFKLITVNAEVTPEILGDYDLDGIVSMADREEWRRCFGMTVAAGAASDGNHNGVIDSADFTVWRDCMETAAATSIPIAIPTGSQLAYVPADEDRLASTYLVEAQVSLTNSDIPRAMMWQSPVSEQRNRLYGIDQDHLDWWENDQVVEAALLILDKQFDRDSQSSDSWNLFESLPEQSIGEDVAQSESARELTPWELALATF